MARTDMQLSERLKAVAGLISHGKKLADVGTDHGYIPIYLIRQERIVHAIAMDIGKGPLERARAHIYQYGLEDRIETRLSDGVRALQPGEADCMIAAGMGGPLIIHILEEGAEVVSQMTECVLQPQSEIAKVRKYLWQHEFTIEQEHMIWEDGKFYPMMRVLPGRKQKLEPELQELYAQYGPCLLKQRHPVLKKFLLKEQSVNQKLQVQLQQHLPNTRGRLAKLEQEAALIEQAIEFMD